MNREKWAKVVAVMVAVLTIAHLTYYFLNKYDFVLFMAGFGILYMGVPLVKKIRGESVGEESRKKDN